MGRKVNVRSYENSSDSFEAVKFSGPREQLKMISDWCDGDFVTGMSGDHKVYIQNQHGVVCAEVGDYIIHAAYGDFHPVSGPLFERTYKKVEDNG